MKLEIGRRTEEGTPRVKVTLVCDEKELITILDYLRTQVRP